jgi:RNA polymerase sigma factor (sigma-70 family)
MPTSVTSTIHPAENRARRTGATQPSWDEIARAHLPGVYNYAYRLTGDRSDAGDLAQDVFVRAFRALPTVAPGNPGGWLRRITRNLYCDRMRRRHRIHFVALPALDTPALVDVRPPPAELLDQRTFDLEVRQAFDALPADTRTAVVLFDIDGLSHEEIATALDVGRGTVRSRLHRGRRHLRSVLGDRAPRIGEKAGRS